MVGPLLVLTHFEEGLIDCLWFHFVDNSGALSSLVRGGSSVESSNITGLTWSHIVGLGACHGSIVSFPHPTPWMAFLGSGCRARGF